MQWLRLLSRNANGLVPAQQIYQPRQGNDECSHQTDQLGLVEAKRDDLVRSPKGNDEAQAGIEQEIDMVII